MTKAICVPFHKYQPYGDEFYAPILTSFMKRMSKYKNEYTKLYLVDSNWNIETQISDRIEIIKVNPHLRYYDAYKEILPRIKEDLILLMDNDMVVYKSHIIDTTFNIIEQGFDVASIYDTIGEYTTGKLNGKNKLCPYWFCTRTDVLRHYTGVEWGPDMPYCETLGHLTEKMVEDNLKLFEMAEDKRSYFYNGTFGYNDGEDHGKDFGYYHIRSGSLPAVLLAWKKYTTDSTYDDYIKDQPKTEYLRQCAWYQYMGGDPSPIVKDVLSEESFENYYEKFLIFHGLI